MSLTSYRAALSRDFSLGHGTLHATGISRFHQAPAYPPEESSGAQVRSLQEDHPLKNEGKVKIVDFN